MKGWPFESWDETYVHKRHGKDRVILQMREEEPWTWVKTYGQGRVFYTASGHDHRCWGLTEYQDLVHLFRIGPIIAIRIAQQDHGLSIGRNRTTLHRQHRRGDIQAFSKHFH